MIVFLRRHAAFVRSVGHVGTQKFKKCVCSVFDRSSRSRSLGTMNVQYCNCIIVIPYHLLVIPGTVVMIYYRMIGYFTLNIHYRTVQSVSLTNGPPSHGRERKLVTFFLLFLTSDDINKRPP